MATPALLGVGVGFSRHQALSAPSHVASTIRENLPSLGIAPPANERTLVSLRRPE
jgi:hypothetical protein